MYANSTSVPVEKSRSELERVLARYGATHFAFATSPTSAVVQFLCRDRAVRFNIPMPNPEERRFKEYQQGRSWFLRAEPAARKLWEQACRSRWRALVLVVKAKLEAVEVGITTFEEEFLAHMVMPNGQTFGEHALPQVERSLTTKTMPKLLLS